MTMGFNLGRDNPFLAFLEEEPRAAYFGFQNLFGKTPARKNYYQNQFQRIYDEYLGTLGQQALGGQAPTTKFVDFMRAFPFTERYAQLPPSMRGEFPGRFNPLTRSIFF